MIKKLKKVLHKEKPADAEKKEGACSCGCGCCNPQKKAGVLVAALVMAGLVGFVGGRIGMGSYVKSHPEEIIKSVENYYKNLEGEQAQGGGCGGAAADAGAQQAQEKGQATAPAALVAEIVNDKSNYSLGNPKGKYVIIEFFDHQCGWCKRTNKEMREAVKRAKNIRWIPIDTPIFGEASETIARFVLAAGEQGKYAEMHEAVGNDPVELSEASRKVSQAVQEYIQANNLDPRSKPEDRAKVEAYNNKMVAKEYPIALANIGKKIGLNGDKLMKAADGSQIRGKLTANKVYAQKLNIHGVPMLIVDGKINPGALLGENLEKAVKESQAKK